MAMLVADCPRCGAKEITFDVKAQVYCTIHYGWQKWYEIFCICRRCIRSAIFLVRLRSVDPNNQFADPDGIVEFHAALNAFFEVECFISIRDNVSTKPPEYVEGDLRNAFTEGAACFSIGCNNAAATMFRLCVDLVTRPLLPEPQDDPKRQPNAKQRRDLGLRLPWLFDNEMIPSALRELATCIKEDGNDGAHVGNLAKEDVEDLLDFTTALLERLVTEPKRLELAEVRRKTRRSPG